MEKCNAVINTWLYELIVYIRMPVPGGVMWCDVIVLEFSYVKFDGVLFDKVIQTKYKQMTVSIE